MRLAGLRQDFRYALRTSPAARRPRFPGGSDEGPEDE